jgi:beta-aspartyl-peptidase (threonine type)
MRLTIHGGAGPPPDDPADRGAALAAAAEAGVAVDTPLDAVETAVRRLESDPLFNAGRGGVVQSDGVVRVDAACMTSDRTVGAVAGVPGVEHAVSAARVVAEETPHVLVAGERAAALAADFGVATGVDLSTDRTRRAFEAADPPDGPPREQLAWLRDRFGATAPAGDDTRDHDTVGAVATDGDRFAAATATAGRRFALAGRVGDVPQVGSGFFCAPAGAASATGAGEDIARVTVARRAVDHLDAGATAARAATLAIEEFTALTDSTAGLIVCDDAGTGSAFDAPSMQVRTAED